ncbi:MAG: hypothetical protein ACI8PT_003801 [Gammaproteobacteria bacterium]|jgi:hypothetical protein
MEAGCLPVAHDNTHVLDSRVLAEVLGRNRRAPRLALVHRREKLLLIPCWFAIGPALVGVVLSENGCGLRIRIARCVQCVICQFHGGLTQEALRMERQV